MPSPAESTTTLTADKHAPTILFLLADTGHDPTEVAVPFQIFKSAGFDIHFATESGTSPTCDAKMLEGWTASILGATKGAKEAYKMLEREVGWKQPLSWTGASFDVKGYDAVFLAGGHEKGVRQIIESETVGALLGGYWPLTRREGGGKKSVVAICHGVQVLANAKGKDGRSVLYDAKTTALPGFMEQSIYQATRWWLGDYYKTYGAGSPSVESFVTRELESPEQFKNSWGMSP